MSFNMTIVEMVELQASKLAEDIISLIFGSVSLSEAMAVICYALRLKIELMKFSKEIENIIDSHDRVWDELAGPAVLSGEERIAVAWSSGCPNRRFCIENKRSLGLSPDLASMKYSIRVSRRRGWS